VLIPAAADALDIPIIASGGFAGRVVLTRMSGALEPVDGDRAHAELLRLERMAHGCALVDHLDASCPERRLMLGRIRFRRLDDLGAALDDCLAIFLVRGRGDGRQDGEVDAEGPVGHRAASRDLDRERLRGRVRQCREKSKRTRIGHGGNQFGSSHPLHLALGDGMVDLEQLCEARRQHRVSLFAGVGPGRYPNLTPDSSRVRDHGAATERTPDPPGASREPASEQATSSSAPSWIRPSAVARPLGLCSGRAAEAGVDARDAPAPGSRSGSEARALEKTRSLK
jgi:hypothetical protein